ncbi:riboflavin biosynthesis protein RibF [Azorhizobium oxalatiphilum]|uniref:Riboflavin biosynthesis protein n=1 Tax=Azorhizobium oxalatiphilum TaxID=980631 RepID=A0A917CB20_9HYPH|nr:bifunctional riboflavin kinase/FAD synthetase [Azorhizobium oxalatiphilum]GGF80562.1 riboflavin biosynthesis protein RibF [Azorhizobium oxalatiphilum]
MSSSSFTIVNGVTALPEALARPVLAIGNFDGVHRGHQAVLAAGLALGKELGRPTLALTFEPHPRSFFQPDVALFRLTPEPGKLAALRAAGLDGAIVLPFDGALAALTAEAFVADILVGAFGIAGAAVGFDFHFGKARSGSPEFLKSQGVQHGFPVRVVEAMLEAGDTISSTAIRKALEAGQVGHAAHMLGRPWSLSATVIHGDKRGRDLGYPTANLALAPEIKLAFGIYAVKLTVDGVTHDAVASYGRRPTFDNGRALLEVHVFDFSGDLYGKEVEVSFHGYLRPELKFDGIEDLIRQMDADSRAARAILAGA